MKNDIEISEVTKNIQELKEINLKIKEQIKQLDEEISELKSQINQLKDNLNDYYHGLLEAGIDAREEGLSWIIKAIWRLECQVNISRMPKFLDSQLVKFIFNVFKK
jgi:predicted  nucleic acid-binding Zn-ribbon protein